MSLSLSIVLVTKDRPGEVRKYLPDVLLQDVLPTEVIVVDSSTGDATKTIVGDLGREAAFPFLHLESLPGTAFQRRKGVDAATGDIILFLDDDVSIESGFTTAILDVFQGHDFAETGGVTGHDVGYLRPSGFDSRNLLKGFFQLPNFGSGRFKWSGFHSTANGLPGVRRVEFLGGAFTAYRRSVLEEIPPDGERFPGPFEDVDLSYRVSRRYTNYYTEHARCRHTPSQTNRRTDEEFDVQVLQYYDTYFRKNIRSWYRRPAFWLARYGVKHGLLHTSPRQLVIGTLEAVCGRALTNKLRSLWRRIRDWDM